jgi:PAS domain S-box-containing protein
MLGRPKSEVVGKNLHELVPESVFEKLMIFKKDYETTKTEIAVFELDMNSDEKSLNIEVTPSVIHEGGKAVGFQATVRSIAERKAMELKLKERYEKMQQAYLELGKVNRQMASLIDISAIISSDFDAEDVFNFILSSIAILAEADTATLRKLNTRRNTLELVATYKMSYVWEKGKILHVKESVSGDAITSADAIKIDNLQNDTVHKYRRFLLSTNLKSIYAIPLQIAGKAIGTLTLYSMQEGKFDKLDEDFVSALVGQAAIALKMYT